MEDSKRPMLTIGVVADILGVSVQTLRLWENKGLINPARKGKDRYYSEDDLNLLKRIKYLLHEKKLNTYGVKELLSKPGGLDKEGEAPFSTDAADAQTAQAPDAGLKTVLIIDDDPGYTSIVKTVLEKEGFRVMTAVTGRDGLARAETDSPDLVILDIMIPDLDGMEVCRALKGNSATSSIPVIISSSMPDNFKIKLNVNELPADAFLMKPPRPSEMLAEVKRLVH